MTLKPYESSDLDGRPQRRTFTAEFKARILDEYDAAPDAGARGAILRRERLYGSHILDWRKARDAGAAAGLTDRRQAAARAAKKAENAELARLQRENARLQAELAKTQTALEIMGKAHALLELLSESADDRADADAVLTEAQQALTPSWGIAAACRLTGRSRATHYRHRTATGRAEAPHPAQATTVGADRDRARSGAGPAEQPEYAGSARPRRCGPANSTRAAGGARSPRCTGSCAPPGRPGTPPPGHPPGPDQAGTGRRRPKQVWSWDITKLRGPVKGVWFHLYMVIDI